MNDLWVVCAVGGGSPQSQAHEQDALGDPSELIDHHGFHSALRVRPSLSIFMVGWQWRPYRWAGATEHGHKRLFWGLIARLHLERKSPR